MKYKPTGLQYLWAFDFTHSLLCEFHYYLAFLGEGHRIRIQGAGIGEHPQNFIVGREDGGAVIQPLVKGRE